MPLPPLSFALWVVVVGLAATALLISVNVHLYGLFAGTTGGLIGGMLMVFAVAETDESRGDDH